jgi:hypothetical protein
MEYRPEFQTETPPNTRPYLILRTGFFAQDNTLLAASVEPSQLGSYVAPPDDRVVMDLEDNAF